MAKRQLLPFKPFLRQVALFSLRNFQALCCSAQVDASLAEKMAEQPVVFRGERLYARSDLLCMLAVSGRPERTDYNEIFTVHLTDQRDRIVVGCAVIAPIA